MMKSKTVLAIIPARGGSKGIPGKNIRKFAGKPLIVHSIQAALQCELIDKTVVTTDSSEIAEIARQYGARVIDRPEELATDGALVIDAIRHAVTIFEAEEQKVDYVILLEPTSPFRRKEDLESCVQVLLEGKADSVATFTDAHVSPNRLWRVTEDTVEPFIAGAIPWLPRQKQPKAYELTGQVYGISRKLLFEDRDAISLLQGKVQAVITPHETALDIDTEFDFMKAEMIMRHFQPESSQERQNITATATKTRTLADLQNLRGKLVFITGGGGHLGTAMCEALAELGATLVIGSRDQQKGNLLSERLSQQFGINANSIKLDITDPSSLDEAFQFIADRHGRLDVLINNAWSGKKNSFESISLEDWKYDIDVCLNGVFYTAQKATPLLKKANGVIVNIASMYGHVAPDYRMYAGTDHVNPPSYGAAKAGVIQLTKYMASFLSTHGIRVNAQALFHLVRSPTTNHS
jgi:CMP-N-acetylneuraminic acid synthetase/NAD(P)-dependent dehydrogenase (short-subunit alcohol dehydrogenase family)